MIDFNAFLEQKVLEDEQKETAEKQFHPSSAGYCERQIFLSKAGLRNFSRYVKGSMMSGKIVHLWIQSHLKNGFKEKRTRTDLIDGKLNSSQLYFEGNADYVENNIVYDFKTTSEKVEKLYSPKDFHVDQLQVYMAGEKSKSGAIVYIDKRTLASRQFKVAFDPARINFLFVKINRIYDALSTWNGSLDEIPFKKCGCFMCKDEILRKNPVELVVH